MPVILVRNPANAYDVNAVEVHVPALGEGAFIGHLAREIAAKIAPLIDAGVEYRAYVNWVRVAVGHEDRPGVDVTIQRVER